MVAKNNRVPNDHLRKYWWRRVKFFFDDEAREQRRAQARLTRAKKMAPRPAEGPLRPIVHCPSVQYNRKVRLGRGFTVEELQAAQINPAQAPFFGIAVDYRRKHTKDENIKQQNIERLKAYKAAIVKVPKGEKGKQVSNPELFALPKPDNEVKFRVIKAEERKQDLHKEKLEAKKAKAAAKKEKKDAHRKK